MCSPAFTAQGARMQEFGVARKAVRPDTPISQLLQGDIRAQWRQLRFVANAALPDLQCPSMVYGACIAAIVLLPGCLWIEAGVPTKEAASLFWLLYFFAFWAIIPGFTDQIPARVATVGAIVPYLRMPEEPNVRPEAVLQRVLRVASEEFDFPVEKFSRIPIL